MSRPSLYINVLTGHPNILAAIDAAEQQLFDGIDYAMSCNTRLPPQAATPARAHAPPTAPAPAPPSVYTSVALKVDRDAERKRAQNALNARDALNAHARAQANIPVVDLEANVNLDLESDYDDDDDGGDEVVFEPSIPRKTARSSPTKTARSSPTKAARSSPTKAARASPTKTAETAAKPAKATAQKVVKYSPAKPILKAKLIKPIRPSRPPVRSSIAKAKLGSKAYGSHEKEQSLREGRQKQIGAKSKTARTVIDLEPAEVPAAQKAQVLRWKAATGGTKGSAAGMAASGGSVATSAASGSGSRNASGANTSAASASVASGSASAKRSTSGIASGSTGGRGLTLGGIPKTGAGPPPIKRRVKKPVEEDEVQEVVDLDPPEFAMPDVPRRLLDGVEPPIPRFKGRSSAPAVVGERPSAHAFAPRSAARGGTSSTSAPAPAPACVPALASAPLPSFASAPAPSFAFVPAPPPSFVSASPTPAFAPASAPARNSSPTVASVSSAAAVTQLASVASKKHDWKPGVAPVRSSLKKPPAAVAPVQTQGSLSSGVVPALAVPPVANAPVPCVAAASSAVPPPVVHRPPIPAGTDTSAVLAACSGPPFLDSGTIPPAPFSGSVSPSAASGASLPPSVPAIASLATSNATPAEIYRPPVRDFPPRPSLPAGRSSIPSRPSVIPTASSPAAPARPSAPVNLLPGTHLIPGVGEINRVAPNGFRQDPDGRLRPVVTLAQTPRVPLSGRQKMAERFADAAIATGIGEMDAVVMASCVEQEIYGKANDLIKYQHLARAEMKKLKNGGQT